MIALTPSKFEKGDTAHILFHADNLSMHYVTPYTFVAYTDNKRTVTLEDSEGTWHKDIPTEAVMDNDQLERILKVQSALNIPIIIYSSIEEYTTKYSSTKESFIKDFKDATPCNGSIVDTIYLDDRMLEIMHLATASNKFEYSFNYAKDSIDTNLLMFEYETSNGEYVATIETKVIKKVH